MQSQIEELLAKEMDRKEFLKIVTAGVVSVVGLGTITGAFMPSKNGKRLQGYGSSAYGGFTKARKN